MNGVIFDAFAARAAVALTRRGSLLGLAAGLAAIMETSPMVAKKRKKSNRADACKAQEGPCELAVRAHCAQASFPDPCRNRLLGCCAHFKTCDAATAFDCFTGGPFAE